VSGAYDPFSEVMGVLPEGWGSEIKPEFNHSGELKKLQREPTDQDMGKAASYLQFLTWLFK
jgi:sarcosine oxidase delta subunit